MVYRLIMGGSMIPKLEVVEKLTEEECVELGGHCYIGDNFTYTTNPPMYSRTCKMCGKKQTGFKRNPIEWM